MKDALLREMHALAESTQPALPPPEPRAKARSQVQRCMDDLYSAVSAAQGKLSLITSLTTGNDLPDAEAIDRASADLGDIGQQIQRASENLRNANERFQKSRKSS